MISLMKRPGKDYNLKGPPVQKDEQEIVFV